MGKYGMAIDNLESAEVVLADGRVVTASDADDADLFWAIRGGGGNFGVVTSFEYRAHPVDMIFGGIAAHPLAAAGEVLDFYRQFTKSLPDELTAFAGLVHAPDGSGTKIVALPVCHCGDLQQAESDVQTAPRVRTTPARPDRPDALPGDQHAARPRVPRRARSTTGSPRSSPSSPTPRSARWSTRSKRHRRP